MSKDRIISSAILIVLTILGYLHKWSFLAFILFLTIGGLYEFFHLVKHKGIPIYSYTGIAIGSLIPISAYYQFSPTKGWELLFIVIVLLMVFVMQLIRNDNTNAVIGISTTFFGVLYVSWFFSYLIKIRFLLPEIPGAGIHLVLFIILITKAGDIGALWTGLLIGKTPLLPKVSPKKTVEGCIGSFLFSILAAFLGQGLIPRELNL